MSKKTIKVKLSWTVEVDVDAWANEYGIEATATAVRDDVKFYFANEEIIPEGLRSIVREV